MAYWLTVWGMGSVAYAAGVVSVGASRGQTRDALPLALVWPLVVISTVWAWGLGGGRARG